MTSSEPRMLETDRCRFSGTRHDGTCGQHAAITATAACVHEHMHADVPVCQYHVEEVAEGDAYCYPCFEADGHDCPLVFDQRAIRDFGEVAHA